MRLAISVSFDPAKGYVISHRELGTVTARRYPTCASSSRRGWDPRLGFGSTGPPDLSVMHVGTAAQAVRKSLVEPAKQADGLSRRRY